MERVEGALLYTVEGNTRPEEDQVARLGVRRARQATATEGPPRALPSAGQLVRVS